MKLIKMVAIIFALMFGVSINVYAQSTVYPVTINYDLSLTKMIKAGQYDWVNSDITSKHFPVTGTGTKEVVTELVHFGSYMKFEDILRELDKCGLRPAAIEELLAFGAKYPELHRFPIVALGSVWRHLDIRDVPCLLGGSGERGLSLGWFEDGWVGGYRFLAVRK